jgi:hypothetical protein
MKLDDILSKIEEIGRKRNMDSSDVQAIKESLKHLEKKFKKHKIIVDINKESVYS